MHPRVQGDLGEASAIQWLTLSGAIVCKPLFHSPEFDLVAEMAGRLVRIEVKTTWRRTPLDHWQAMLCTRGGNQSWNKTTKNFDPRRCEFVFVHVGDGRRWFIPSTRIEGVTAIVLGGRKYSQFEIEAGFPLPARTVQEAPSTIASR
jgi:Holliday junction resolvase-like predicted endonuclease